MRAFSIITVVAYFFSSCRGEDACNLDWDISYGFRPLILDISLLNDEQKILLPLPSPPGISVSSGTILAFACSGVNENIQNMFKSTLLNMDHAIGARCEGKKLVVDGKEGTFGIEDMGCSHKITSEIIKKKDPKKPLEEKKCGKMETGIWWQIAFDYNSKGQSDKFYPQIDVCFEEDMMTTLWTVHNIYGKSLKTPAGKAGDETFLQTGNFFCPIDMTLIYKWDEQKKILPVIIESKKISFHKGHLSPNGDFITGAAKLATYNYINALPQWQPYNGDNWRTMERDIVELAKDNGAILNIMSGGALIVRNENLRNAFLAQSLDKPLDKVPIPYYLWKIVVAEKEDGKKAVAFVINNNPLVPKPPLDMHPCENDVCHQLTWIREGHQRNMKIEGKGYTFCCEVNELKETIFPNAPIIKGASLLNKL